MTQQALIIGTIRMFFAAASSFISRTTYWGKLRGEKERAI
jgi:hypothetical protein